MVKAKPLLSLEEYDKQLKITISKLSQRSVKSIARCTACGVQFWRSRDVPDEWQCLCGGLIKNVR